MTVRPVVRVIGDQKHCAPAKQLLIGDDQSVAPFNPLPGQSPNRRRRPWWGISPYETADLEPDALLLVVRITVAVGH